MVFIREIIPFDGRTIQVSEILQFTQDGLVGGLEPLKRSMQSVRKLWANCGCLEHVFFHVLGVESSTDSYSFTFRGVETTNQWFKPLSNKHDVLSNNNQEK